MKRVLCSLALTLVWGCTPSSAHVHLQGDPVSIAWLAGTWQGEYQGGSSGRRGSLSFYLPAGTDSLVGEVMMTDPAGKVIHAAERTGVYQPTVRRAQLLRIDVVVVSGELIRGVLEPYVAPDCGCVVSTTFLGRVAGNDIKGTFETRGGSGYHGDGTWQMTRTGSTR